MLGIQSTRHTDLLFHCLQTVSKKHAEIEAQSPESSIFIKDLKSSNRTKINAVSNTAYLLLD